MPPCAYSPSWSRSTIELAEQPVASLEEAAEVAGATSIPIAGDESVETAGDAERARDLNACALAGVKLSKVGGPEAAIEIAEVLPSYVSSALDGPVGIAAGAQVAQTLDAGTEGRGPWPTASPPSGSSPRRSPRSSASCATACSTRPTGSGLGVEIDEAALQAHRL